MLEYWYKERRTLVDFRRGVLGSHFDGFAAWIKTKGFPKGSACDILGKCCQFNNYLIDQQISRCTEITEPLIESFLDVYYADYKTTAKYTPRDVGKRAITHLLTYLVEVKAIKPAKPMVIKKPYSWILNSYLKQLRDDGAVTEKTIVRSGQLVEVLLESLGRKVKRQELKRLAAETVAKHMKQITEKGIENAARQGSALRSFFRFCFIHKYMRADFSGLVPSIRRYRHAALPKGLEDSALERMLKQIDTVSAIGARNYAIIVLMMAYGMRGVSAAEMLLEDIDWQNSRIRIRAQKGGKEVVVPLLEPVGEAIIKYLQHRYAKSPFREVFLTAKAPFRPLTGLVISNTIRKYLKRAGIQIEGGGSNTLRHSWAIRALRHDAPIKAIADVLGHRYIDTTFIYAKTDLKTLR